MTCFPGATYSLIGVAPTCNVTITICGESIALGSETVTSAVYVPAASFPGAKKNCIKWEAST